MRAILREEGRKKRGARSVICCMYVCLSRISGAHFSVLPMLSILYIHIRVPGEMKKKKKIVERTSPVKTDANDEWRRSLIQKIRYKCGMTRRRKKEKEEEEEEERRCSPS